MDCAKGRGGALRRVCNKCTSFAIYALRKRTREWVHVCVYVLYKFSILYLFSAKFRLLREMAVAVVPSTRTITYIPLNQCDGSERHETVPPTTSGQKFSYCTCVFAAQSYEICMPNANIVYTHTHTYNDMSHLHNTSLAARTTHNVLGQARKFVRKVTLLKLIFIFPKWEFLEC